MYPRIEAPMTSVKSVGNLTDETTEEVLSASVNPTRQVLMRSKRHLPDVAKHVSETFSQENVQINESTELYGGSSGVKFNEKDLYSRVKKVRESINECGDAETVRAYFQQMGKGHKDFYYAIKTDEVGRAISFVWVDGKSRLAYRQFGDVMTFDTTYRTNKYSMPFGPFTGVNHHQQSIFFGCALLETEEEETYIWAFKHWLEAMEGKYPISIITIQDEAISNAVAKVFPNTRHRFCLWHIERNLGLKFKHRGFRCSNVKKAMKQCIHETHTINDFEKQWAALLVEYNLQDDGWIKELYEIRQSWIPVYCRDTFFAGVDTTRRSESINYFFNGFVTAKKTLIEFVITYDEALESIYANENKEDYVSIYKHPAYVKSPLLIHASKIYTRNMFQKFEEEANEAYLLRADETELDGDVQTYVVCHLSGNNGKFVVRMNLTTKEGSCGCRLFEFLGIPCKHLCGVFYRLCISEIPSHFILKRWTKDANRTEKVPRDAIIIRERVREQAVRYCCLLKVATKCINVASASDEGFVLCSNTLQKQFEQLHKLDDNVHQKDACQTPKENGHTPVTKPCESRVEALLLDPHISQMKDRKRTNQATEIEIGCSNEQLKSGLENADHNKKARICQTCKGVNVGHDSRNCPKNQASDVEIGCSNERMKSGLEKVAGSKKPRVCQTCKGVNVGHDSRNCPTNQASDVEIGCSNERIKSGLEKADHNKKPRVCQTCKGVNVGHDSRNCPKSPQNILKRGLQDESDLDDVDSSEDVTTR